jgi:hypothetical protein
MLFCIQAYPQDISNIRSFEEDGKTVIIYDLLSINPGKQFYVKLFRSEDGGKLFKPYGIGTSGEVNTITKPGYNKIGIVEIANASLASWRLDAVAVGVAQHTITSRGVTVQILDVTKSASEVTFSVSILNKNDAQNTTANQFIITSFLIIDDTNKAYREASGDTNKMLTVPLNEQKVFLVTLKDVGANVKSFSQVDFIASSVTAKFTNVKIASTEN